MKPAYSLHPEHLDCVGTASSGWLALVLKPAVTHEIKQHASQIRSWRDRKQKPECFTWNDIIFKTKRPQSSARITIQCGVVQSVTHLFHLHGGASSLSSKLNWISPYLQFLPQHSALTERSQWLGVNPILVLSWIHRPWSAASEGHSGP